MKRFLFFFPLFVAGIGSTAQSIDSVRIINNSTPPSFYIEGTFPHTGFELARVEYATSSDTVNISMFFKECGGFAAITHFDSLIAFDQAFPAVPDYIYIQSFRDSNTVDTSCVQRVEPILVDSLLISQNTSNLENLNLYNRFIKLYPNPVNDQLTIEIEGVQSRILDVEIIDFSGKLVRSEKWTKNNDKAKINVDLRQLPPGEYILSIGDGRNFHENRAFQKY